MSKKKQINPSENEIYRYISERLKIQKKTFMKIN